jgi:hypothetical protein
MWDLHRDIAKINDEEMQSFNIFIFFQAVWAGWGHSNHSMYLSFFRQYGLVGAIHQRILNYQKFSIKITLYLLVSCIMGYFFIINFSNVPM